MMYGFSKSHDSTMSAATDITCKQLKLQTSAAGKVYHFATTHFEGIILSMTGITFQTGNCSTEQC
jgi:hypothetical protein